MARMDLRVLQDHKDQPVLKVLQDQQAHQAQQDHKDQLV
jgi:hypothetical protein